MAFKWLLPLPPRKREKKPTRSTAVTFRIVPLKFSTILVFIKIGVLFLFLLRNCMARCFGEWVYFILLNFLVSSSWSRTMLNVRFPHFLLWFCNNVLLTLKKIPACKPFSEKFLRSDLPSPYVATFLRPVDSERLCNRKIMIPLIINQIPLGCWLLSVGRVLWSLPGPRPPLSREAVLQKRTNHAHTLFLLFDHTQSSSLYEISLPIRVCIPLIMCFLKCLFSVALTLVLHIALKKPTETS